MNTFLERFKLQTLKVLVALTQRQGVRPTSSGPMHSNHLEECQVPEWAAQPEANKIWPDNQIRSKFSTWFEFPFAFLASGRLSIFLTNHEMFETKSVTAVYDLWIASFLRLPSFKDFKVQILKTCICLVETLYLEGKMQSQGTTALARRILRAMDAIIQEGVLHTWRLEDLHLTASWSRVQ